MIGGGVEAGARASDITNRGALICILPCGRNELLRCREDEAGNGSAVALCLADGLGGIVCPLLVLDAWTGSKTAIGVRPAPGPRHWLGHQSREGRYLGGKEKES